MLYAIFAALVVVAFLVVLNGFLAGAKKAQADAVLSLLLIGLVVAAFIVAGWRWGLLAIGVAILSAAVTRPAAASLAAHFMAAAHGGGGPYVGLPPRRLQEISRQLGAPMDPKTVMAELTQSGVSPKASAREALLNYCEQQSSTQALLTEFGVARDDLDALYSMLIHAGAGQWACGHWVAASALAYPDCLRYVLQRRRQNWQATAIGLIWHFEQGSSLEP